MPLGAWGLVNCVVSVCRWSFHFKDIEYLHRPDELISTVLFLLLFEGRRLVFLEAIVALTDHALDGRELARLLLDTHGICL
jgi:hypothetical protein